MGALHPESVVSVTAAKAWLLRHCIRSQVVPRDLSRMTLPLLCETLYTDYIQYTVNLIYYTV